jgi:hypothetical protein
MATQSAYNLWANPALSPPFPAWDINYKAGTLTVPSGYTNGDCVSYNGQNFVANVISGGRTTPSFRPDTHQLSLSGNLNNSGFHTTSANGVPPAVNSFVLNPNGSEWINLTLLTPPSPVWDPRAVYGEGDFVMWPASPPGTTWRATQIVPPNKVPGEKTPTPLLSPAGGLQVPQSNGNPVYWELITTPQPISFVQPR